MSERQNAMGMRRRRSVLGAGAAGLGGAALVACGGTGTSGTGAQATAQPQRGPVSIDVLTRDGVSAASGHSQFYNKQAKNLFTPETGITVNFLDAQPSVGEKLTIMAAGGTLPDGSWFGLLADGSAGREQAIRGIFKPLDDTIKKDAKFDKAPYFKTILDAATVNGKLYGLPTHSHYGTNVLYYNKTMTRGAGINVPDNGTWSSDDFILAAQKLVKKDQDIWGFVSPWGYPEFGMFYLRQFGGEWLDEAGKKCLLDSAEARAGMEWIYNTAAKFQTIDSHYRADAKGPDVLFKEGKLAFVSWTPGFVAQWKNPGADQITPANGRFDLGVALFPTGPNGRRGTQVSGSAMGVTGTTKQEATWEWIKFATNKLNGVEQVFGGAGSPGGRTDVWNDAKLLSFDPIYTTIVKAYPQGAGTLRLPANNRYTDVLKATGDELTPFFRGQVGVTDAAGKATLAVNALLG